MFSVKRDYIPEKTVVTEENPSFVCVCVCAQLCLTLCDPMDRRPLGSSVHGIL